MANLKIKKCTKLPKTESVVNPKFGTVFSPHMLKMTFSADTQEFEAEITPFQSELMSPASLVLHYGQSIFEGMKAYRQKDGTVAIFRADLHAKRFKNSARIMAMTPVPEDIFMKCILEYVNFEQESVPSEDYHALYLRPLLIASDEVVKLGPSKKYTFYIMATLAGKYFTTDKIVPAKVLVNKSFIRAFPGGTGEAKTAGNYAASLQPQAYAAQLGCDQVLYLDAIKREFIDELGGMNFFMVRNNELVTPKLTGAILNGITRRSVLELAEGLGFKAKEEPISFTELQKNIHAGIIKECFACGTAATVHPIGTFLVQEDPKSAVQTVNLHKDFPVALKVLNKLTAVQRGAETAPGDWLSKV